MVFPKGTACRLWLKTPCTKPAILGASQVLHISLLADAVVHGAIVGCSPHTTLSNVEVHVSEIRAGQWEPNRVPGQTVLGSWFVA